MRILIASNSYKNSLSASEACRAIKEGLSSIDLQASFLLCPISDGGSGICSVALDNGDYKRIDFKTTNAFDKPLQSHYAYSYDRKKACIESALIVGIQYFSFEELDPMNATSYGLGIAIKDALSRGAEKIVIGVGDTCTNDGGMGMLSALGVKFYDKEGNILKGCGKDLLAVDHLDDSSFLLKDSNVEVILANDVDNVLFGPTGASYVYAPQKGANKEEVELLDKGLRNFAKVNTKHFNYDIANKPGCGCGGGLGYALQLFLKAVQKNGFDVVCNHMGLAEKVKESDIIITGEGRIDEQTLSGKGTYLIAKMAKQFNKEVIAICGQHKESIKINEFDKVYPLNKYITNRSIEELIANGYLNLKEVAIMVGEGLKDK